MIWGILAIIALSYLIGSIPFSYIVARLIAGKDVRYEGEGNVGARNVWHLAGPLPGLLAGFLDVSKGFVVYRLASHFTSNELIIYLAGLAAVLGHGFPLFLKGRGGKGISVALGFLLNVIPQAILLGVILLSLAWAVTRNFNVSAGVGLGSMVLLALLWVPLGEWLKILGLMMILAFKKILDRPHETAVRQKSGWFEPKGVIQR
ncbi:MAG: glycerol-3-phosphate acyltransferase [Anaerolineae bacterium]|nr:glycerol-3-phosphate acyltransferase [Anaerolineae bacterium]MDW8101356.1 glycerol-3-phosphate acyltransferase [Anaerolineae bacterium]